MKAYETEVEEIVVEDDEIIKWKRKSAKLWFFIIIVLASAGLGIDMSDGYSLFLIPLALLFSGINLLIASKIRTKKCYIKRCVLAKYKLPIG